jgi:hypothetical protein
MSTRFNVITPGNSQENKVISFARTPKTLEIPYDSGETPQVNDEVIHVNGECLGVVTNVALNQGNLRGADQVSVKWDDGGPGVGMALADEFILVHRPGKSGTDGRSLFLRSALLRASLRREERNLSIRSRHPVNSEWELVISNY